MDGYFEGFGGVRDYLRSIVDVARKDGYTATILGRRRYLPDLTSDNRQRREMAERMALNAPIQGSAADIIKVAMLGVHRALRAEGLRSRMLLQVHDELVLRGGRGRARGGRGARAARDGGGRAAVGAAARSPSATDGAGTTRPTDRRLTAGVIASSPTFRGFDHRKRPLGAPRGVRPGRAGSLPLERLFAEGAAGAGARCRPGADPVRPRRGRRQRRAAGPVRRGRRGAQPRRTRPSSGGCWPSARSSRSGSTAHQPDVVAIERVFSQQNVRTVMGTAQASGWSRCSPPAPGCRWPSTPPAR